MPRYSGVRPTISPAMKTASTTINQNAVHARADAAEDHFAEHDVGQRHHAAERREADRASQLTAPHEASVVTVAKSALLAMPKRTSLPSMLPPDCVALTRLITFRRAADCRALRPSKQ